MSESVQIALITLASALIGTIFGFLSAWITARISAKTQVEQTVLTQLFPARLDAYRQFETAMREWSDAPTKANYAGIYRAANMVTLLSDEETVHRLDALTDVLRSAELHGVVEDQTALLQRHLALLHAMNHDIMTLTAPTIKTDAVTREAHRSRNTKPFANG